MGDPAAGECIKEKNRETDAVELSCPEVVSAIETTGELPWYRRQTSWWMAQINRRPAVSRLTGSA